MPETYGVPEEEPTTTETVVDALTQAIAGQGVLRRVVLYAVLGSAIEAGVFFTPFLIVAAVAVLLLVCTDTSL